MHLSRQRGFTPMEVMIVIITLCAVVAAGVPILTHSIERSREAEARSALTSIRRAMRMYYLEHGTYEDPQFLSGRRVDFGGVLELNERGLEGRYFSSECYTFDIVKRKTFRIRCAGSASTAPSAREVAQVVLMVNQNGDIWKGGASGEGPVPVLAAAAQAGH
jgi:type II secretory pathway pseudopilin PulG